MTNEIDLENAFHDSDQYKSVLMAAEDTIAEAQKLGDMDDFISGMRDLLSDGPTYLYQKALDAEDEINSQYEREREPAALSDWNRGCRTGWHG